MTDPTATAQQHTFLQRLPGIPQLRSLYLPFIADYTIDPKELALQIADIITLRPEIQLCYIGISTKCFEILEAQGSDAASLANGGSSDPLGGEGGPSDAGSAAAEVGVASGDDETTDDDDDDDDDGFETEEEGTPTSHTDPDETQSEASEPYSDDDSFLEPDEASITRLRLREILFYDDKVAIFKARHGRL